MNPMLITLSTDKTVSEAATALQAAVQAHHFGTLLAMFKEPQLEGVARDVEDTILSIMKEAAQETGGPR
jgi:hypothetical protein